jgi:hypothetical protein
MSNIYHFHGLRTMNAMGKTARGSYRRALLAQPVEHLAILPWRSLRPSVVRQRFRRVDTARDPY